MLAIFKTVDRVLTGVQRGDYVCFGCRDGEIPGWHATCSLIREITRSALGVKDTLPDLTESLEVT